MTVRKRPTITNATRGKSKENTESTKTNTSNKDKKITSKSGNSSGSNSVKNNMTNNTVYMKIGEVFGRDKVNENKSKMSIQSKQKPRKKQNKAKNFNENDDNIDLIGDMTESERKQWVEDYLSHLPEYNKMTKPSSNELKFEQGAGDAYTAMYKYKPPTPTYLKSDFFNSPYIISNIVNFSQKNHSFNKYQTWKIRRENLKICEKIKSLENRKLSTDYYHPTLMKKNYFPNSQAINRTIENRRISAENMVLRYMINKIKNTPNKKAPWYNPDDERYIKIFKK